MVGDKRRAVEEGVSQGPSQRRRKVNLSPPPPTSLGTDLFAAFTKYVLPSASSSSQVVGPAAVPHFVGDLMNVSFFVFVFVFFF